MPALSRMVQMVEAPAQAPEDPTAGKPITLRSTHRRSTTPQDQVIGARVTPGECLPVSVSPSSPA